MYLHIDIYIKYQIWAFAFSFIHLQSNKIEGSYKIRKTKVTAATNSGSLLEIAVSA